MKGHSLPAAEKDEKPVKERYLRALAQLGTLTGGCKAARVSPNTVYKWRTEDVAFAAAEHEAREACADEIESALIRRAKRRSDTAAIFLLKGLRREKYGDHVTLDVRQQAERLASELGLDATELLAEAERIVAGAVSHS